MLTNVPSGADQVTAFDQDATRLLVLAQYLAGQFNLESLALKLHLNRIDARQTVADFLNAALAISNVPVEAVTQLSHRLAVSNSQVSRLNLELAETRQELDAERRNLANLARQIGPLHRRLNSLRDTVEITRSYLALVPSADPDLLARLTAALEAEELFVTAELPFSDPPLEEVA